ncbi:MAG: hypothetical protein K0S71_1072 [Clostridia bacterium]|jgi:hypothetical protein|nr:hypothetical protein [Clostridia bacterium]
MHSIVLLISDIILFTSTSYVHYTSVYQTLIYMHKQQTVIIVKGCDLNENRKA